MFYKLNYVIILFYFINGITSDFPGIPINEYSFVPLLRSSLFVPPGRQYSIDDIRFLFYNGTNPYEYVTYKYKNIKRILQHKNYNPELPFVVYIHGYAELTTDESILTVVDGYLTSKDKYNVIVMDWANFAYGNYLPVSLRVKLIGNSLGKALITLLQRKIDINKLHLVGHSLGSHVAAFASRAIKSEGYLLPRLTALDPAFPGFHPPLFGLAPLSKKDAKFVDVIHTGALLYGTPVSCGHVDFWPNGGRERQPGCQKVTILFSWEDFCSHHRSWRFWAESVKVRKSFPAVKCQSYDTFTSGRCSQHSIGYMGQDAQPSLRGDYYLSTNEVSPFSKGLSGIR